MAATTSISVTGTVTGLTEGTNSISFTYSNTASPGLRDIVSSVVGGTTLTIPASTLFVVLVPPAGNTVAWRVSGTTTDVDGGIPMHLTNPVIIPIAAASPEMVLYSATTIANIQVYYL